MIATNSACLVAALCALLAGSCPFGTAAKKPVNLAVLHGTFDSFRHSDEHDAVLRQFGWQFAKYSSTELKRLAGALGQYDLVLGNALFNYCEVQDHGAYADEWRAFMDWLGKLGETFDASVADRQAYVNTVAPRRNSGAGPRQPSGLLSGWESLNQHLAKRSLDAGDDRGRCFPCLPDQSGLVHCSELVQRDHAVHILQLHRHSPRILPPRGRERSDLHGAEAAVRLVGRDNQAGAGLLSAAVREYDDVFCSLQGTPPS